MPIVSPMWIYWIDVVSNIRTGFFILWSVTVALLIVLGVTLFAELEDYDFKLCELKGYGKKILGFFKKFVVALLITTSIMIFIPSKETMYTMFVADNVTYERLEQGQEKVKDIIDYIFNKIDEEK